MQNLTNKKFILVGLGVVALLVLVMVIVIVMKSQTASTPTPKANAITPQVQKVDLASQPQWVQDLKVTAVKGASANGLANVTVKVTGIPVGTVNTLEYILQYQTSNRGSQGALSTKPQDLAGATTWTKTIDLGTCSTKTCVDHQGVTSVDLEIDFNTADGRFVWSNTIEL